MTIVTVLLGCILGVVLHYTGQNMEMQNINMMRTMASMPLQPGILETVQPEAQQAPFFFVQIGSNGEVMDTTGAEYDRDDWEYLQELVDHALDSDGETGVIEAHDLRYLKVESPFGGTVFFADLTAERQTLQELAHSYLLILLVALAVFLVISIFLSYLVIRPVEQAWDQQRQFVADASHELKTPLSVIMANAELMQNEDTSRDDHKKYSGNILAMTYQMRSLVENMLDLARVDSGNTKANMVRLDLSQLVTDAALSFQLLYEEREMELRWEVPEDIWLQGSEQHLYQVMDILLDNALKYAAPKGTVCVELTAAGKNCLLSVKSPGEAISKEDLTNIFKRFYRIDKARTMDGSYGLGLSIAETVVEAHGGKIWAESQNGYNTFFVQLPLHQ